MSDRTLDENIDNIIREENPQAEAVKSLINIKPRVKGVLNTDVELRTDLNTEEIKKHTKIAILSNIVDMDEKEFSQRCILGDLSDVKERKAISKDRQSRAEIVTVARNPDMSMQNDEIKEGWLKRFFTPKRQRE